MKILKRLLTKCTYYNMSIDRYHYRASCNGHIIFVPTGNVDGKCCCCGRRVVKEQTQ